MMSALRRRVKTRLKGAVYSALPPSRLLQRGPRERRQIALTFDDGPDALTTAYLDALDELEARATFFLVGTACERHPDLAREYSKRGHQVASHGYDHQRFTQLDWRALRAQLRRTDDLLAPVCTDRPWVRPPYGNVDARVLAQLLGTGYMIALWSLDSHDYELHDAAQVQERCAPRHVAPGEVILMHEGQRWTLEALPRIARSLRMAGYELVTMAEMFAA